VISARALGVYVYLRATEAQISAESLASAFPEGREAMATSLRELRTAGLIETKKTRINGRIITVSQLVETDYWAPETRLLLQQTQLNSNLNIDAYSYKILKRLPSGAREEENVDYEVDVEYEKELKRRAEKKRQEEYAELKAMKASRTIEELRSKEPVDWNASDSAHEFARRMEGLWYVKPWLTARTRFKGALAQARKVHGTNGELEVKMMDRFFAGLEHNKKINDPEIIWKLFIRDFGSILLDVQRSTVTVDDIEEAKQLSDKQWGNF